MLYEVGGPRLSGGRYIRDELRGLGIYHDLDVREVAMHIRKRTHPDGVRALNLDDPNGSVRLGWVLGRTCPTLVGIRLIHRVGKGHQPHLIDFRCGAARRGGVSDGPL